MEWIQYVDSTDKLLVLSESVNCKYIKIILLIKINHNFELVF